MGLLQRFSQALPPVPSFGELELERRARGRRLSRASVRKAIAAQAPLAPPAASRAASPE